MKAGGRPTDILEKLNEMAGFAPNKEILLYEVCDILFTISVFWIAHSLGPPRCFLFYHVMFQH